MVHRKIRRRMGIEPVKSRGPHRRGKWAQNQISYFTVQSWRTYWSGRKVFEFATGRQHQRAHEFECPCFEVSEEPTPGNGACKLLALPSEILLEIVRFAVPTNQVFHIVHPIKKQPAICPVFVQKMIIDHEKLEWPRVEVIQFYMTALATVCRRLSELYYTVFYGENQFVFQFARYYDSPLIDIDTDATVQSWSRMFHEKQETTFPLTPSIAPYIADVGFINLFPSFMLRRGANYDPYSNIRLQPFLILFASEHKIKRLEIDLRVHGNPDVYGKLCLETNDKLRLKGDGLPIKNHSLGGVTAMIKSLHTSSKINEVILNGEVWPT